MKQQQIIECVANVSEGRDVWVVEQIARAIDAQPGSSLLHVDRGVAAHRTVYTFAGEASAVCRAAFAMVERAAELIDMSVHSGEHPRIGAVDVLPLVPVSGISLDDCVVLARDLSGRIYRELAIPVYNYEAAASVPERRLLESVRRGEYEGLAAKMIMPGWEPDFGTSEFTQIVARSGAVIVGARNFLIAVNFNLDTESVAVARAVARRVRESGYGGVPGTLPGCKAIGWYIPEYGCAQVSMNITDINRVALHEAFMEVERVADEMGYRVTGTEIIGLIPQRVLSEAGEEMIARMNLSDIVPFVARDRVIEQLLARRGIM